MHCARARSLVNHMKEMILHCNIKRDDKVFYYTTTGWMMWNWLMSALSVGATVVVWEGNPCYPEWDSLWKMAEETNRRFSARQQHICKAS